MYPHCTNQKMRTQKSAEAGSLKRVFFSASKGGGGGGYFCAVFVCKLKFHAKIDELTFSRRLHQFRQRRQSQSVSSGAVLT